MWRSARVLFRAGAIVTPDNIRALVEPFMRIMREPVPEGLAKSEMTSEGQGPGEDIYRNGQSPAPHAGTGRKTGWLRARCRLWDSDVHTPTRVSEVETRVIRLGCLQEITSCLGRTATVLRAPGLCRRSPSTPGRVAAESDDLRLAPKLAAVKESWPEFDRAIPLVVLFPGDGNWAARCKKADGSEQGLWYNKSSGLGFEFAAPRVRG